MFGSQHSRQGFPKQSSIRAPPKSSSLRSKQNGMNLIKQNTFGFVLKCVMSFFTCFSFVLSLYTSYITSDKLLSLTPVEYARYSSPSVYASKYSIMIADFLYWHLTPLLYKKLVGHLYQRTSMLPPNRLLIYLQILLSST